MAYTKTVWHTGDVVSSTGLNNIENGIEAAHTGCNLGILFVTGTSQEFIESGETRRLLVLDHTFAEIAAAPMCFLTFENNDVQWYGVKAGVAIEEGFIRFNCGNEEVVFLDGTDTPVAPYAYNEGILPGDK